MNEAILHVENVTKDYIAGTGTLPVLKGVSFQLDAGERAVITGVSGSGKSTLLNIAGLLDAPTAGRMYLDGQEVESVSESRKNGLRSEYIGFIFQFNQLLRDFNVLENVALPGYLAGMKKNKALEAAAELLPRVGLTERASFYPEKLSGGEAQRTAIARALMNEPRILLADEPTGNLDTGTKKDIQALLEQVSKETGTTLLIVTHDLSFTSFCERHLHLEDGVIEEQ